MILVCYECNKEFEVTYKNRHRKFCSHSCSMKNRWKNTEYKNHMKGQQKIVHNSDSWKNAQSKIQSKLANTTERKTEFRKRMTKYFNGGGAEKLSEIRRNLWKNPDYAKKQLNSCFSYKDYLMPSGRIVKLQGYEPQVLDELLKTYDENDIVIGIKELNKTIGRVSYIEDNIERTYYPDFYIKSTNTIIEVKSKYTYEKHKRKNVLKKKACIDKGFKFKLIIK